jgi:hypothetical protein
VSETDTNQQNDTKNLPAETAGAVQEASEIPKFDLAEQILAEQRKVTAVKRKAPIKKDGPAAQEREAESIGCGIQQPPAVLSEREQIVAEIVARDIDRLLTACRDE